ncbi:MAG: hypothetical protein ACLPVY_23505 [Acidimicrobiia bacterium]
MTTKLSREHALEHRRTPDTDVAQCASPVVSDRRVASVASFASGASGRATSGGRASRVGRLRARRARSARWRRASAALGAVVFAGLGSVTLVSSAAVADTSPAPNSVQAFGNAPLLGSDSAVALHAGVVGIAADPAGRGYWLVGADGGIFAFGGAPFYGSTGGEHLNAPVVGMAATPDGGGYWLVGADGGVFAFGDAPFEGSTANVTLAAPIVAIVPTADGQGYWLVGADGGIFAFGDAPFYGSTAGVTLAAPIVGAALTSTGHGYWLVGADGGVFAFGDASFFGSQLDPGHSVVGIAASRDGDGYWVARADGSVAGFATAVAGNASTIDANLVHPDTVGIAASAGGGYWLAQGAAEETSSLANDRFLVCTRAHESNMAGGYRAVSPGGTYRGAYQFDQSTWDGAARLAGRDDLVGVDPAAAAPADQDLVAITLFHELGAQPWGDRCRGLE